MNAKTEQMLVKTPQGVNATRSGIGLSLKAHTMLKLFDGVMPVAAFKDICLGASMSEADFQATIKELLEFDHLRVVANAAAAEPEPRISSDAERRMLLTLDFTVGGELPLRKSTKSAAPAYRAPAAAVAASAPARPPAVKSQAESTPSPASEEEDRTTRLKRETEIRQKLMATLQPRIEEELRARLRPKLEQELRPKLIAALRPGIEAEIRSSLVKELSPRVELELKARFAKTLAAQKAADLQNTAAEPAPAPAPIIAASSADSATERLLASVSAPLFSLDKTGVCSYMSPAWAQFSGYAVSDVVGKHLADFFGDGDRRAITAMLTGIANGTALRFEQQGEFLRKDEESLWVEVSAAPLTSADGKSTGVCGVIRDAVELRRASEQAEADGLRLLLLVEQIDTGVILEDREGNIQQANPALCTMLSLDAAPYSLEGMAVGELFELAAKSFIGPDGFLRRVSEMRGAGEDAKGESFVMADGRVLALDFLVVTVGEDPVGHLWLLREMQRPQARIVS